MIKSSGNAAISDRLIGDWIATGSSGLEDSMNEQQRESIAIVIRLECAFIS